MPTPSPSRSKALLAAVAGAALLLATASVAAQSQEPKPTGSAATPVATQPRPTATPTVAPTVPAAGSPEPATATAATPVAPATPTEPSGVDGNSYSSPGFGFGFSWDPHVWQVQGERAVADFTGLQLGTSDSSVFVEGIRDYGGDPTVCLADMQLQLTDRANPNSVADATGKPRPMIDPPGAESYLRVFEVDQPGSKPLRVVEWTQCRNLVPEDSVLVLSWDVPEDAFTRDLPKVVELLDSLEIPRVADAPNGRSMPSQARAASARTWAAHAP